jgi:hypothetical protein
MLRQGHRDVICKTWLKIREIKERKKAKLALRASKNEDNI